MKIILPFKTPTINHLYYHKGNIKIMKKEAKDLRKEIIEIVLKSKTLFKGLENHPLGVDVAIFENWHCKDGSIKKKDVANREKFLIDSVYPDQAASVVIFPVLTFFLLS